MFGKIMAVASAVVSIAQVVAERRTSANPSPVAAIAEVVRIKTDAVKDMRQIIGDLRSQLADLKKAAASVAEIESLQAQLALAIAKQKEINVSACYAVCQIEEEAAEAEASELMQEV
jgi:TolA-binding protein